MHWTAASCWWSVPTAAFTITKLAWLAENEPDNFTRMRLAMLPHDWLTMQLCGRAVSDRGDSSGTGYFDPVSNTWCEDLLALVDPDPVSVIERTENLARTITGALGATVHYALLDRSDSTVTYTSAGHPPALVIQSDGTAEFLANGRRPVLAAVNDSSPRSATRVLDPDDVLVIYSDGLIERRGESIDEGLERLRSTAEGLGVEGSVDELVDRLTRAMLTGTNQRDDVCMLAVRQRQRDEDGGSVET